MPVNPQILSMIANPTQGRLGDIGQTYVSTKLAAEKNRMAQEKLDVETMLANANMDQAEMDLFKDEAKALYGATSAYLSDVSGDPEKGIPSRPELATDPRAYEQYMNNLTEGMPSGVVDKFKGLLPPQIAELNSKTGAIVSVMEGSKTSQVPTKRTRVVRVDKDSGLVYKKDTLYNPDGTPREESPEYADIDVTAATELTKSQTGKELIDFQDATVASLNMIDVATEVVEAIRTSPQSAGYSGNILSGVNEVVRTMGGLVETMRPDMAGDKVQIGNGKNAEIISKQALGDRYSDELSKFRNSAIWNEELDSMLINLAYQAAAAKGQTGRGLSDKDLEMNMKEVGKTTDPIGVERVIKRFALRTVKAYRNKATVKGKENSKYVDMVDNRIAEFEKLFSESSVNVQDMSDEDILKGLSQ